MVACVCVHWAGTRMEQCLAFCVTCFLPCNEKDDQVGVEPARIIPLTWQNGQVCTLLQIGSNPNASHQRSLSTARACWCWMTMPESWCHRRIALAGLRCGWMDIGYVCVSISQPAPFSHSHAQEPGCHIVLLLPIPTRSYDWPVLGMEHLEKKLCKRRGSKFSERWSPYSLEVKTALQQQRPCSLLL